MNGTILLIRARVSVTKMKYKKVHIFFLGVLLIEFCKYCTNNFPYITSIFIIIFL